MADQVLVEGSLQRPGDAMNSGSRHPPDIIDTILDATPSPSYIFDRSGTKVLKLQLPSPYPPVAELMHDRLGLAGMRIDPVLHNGVSPSDRVTILSVSLVDVNLEDLGGKTLDDLPTRPLRGVPAGMVFANVSWSPDSAHVAFMLRSAGGCPTTARGPQELWVASATDMHARLVSPRLNTVFCVTYKWLGSDAVIAAVIPEGQGDMPARSPIPLKPSISDNPSFEKVPEKRTFPDLLQNDFDIHLFQWLGMSHLVIWKLSDNQECKPAARSMPKMFAEFSPSPDGSKVLVTWIEKPFSFVAPVGTFPRIWAVWDGDLSGGPTIYRRGNPVSARGGVIAGDSTRGIQWRADKACTLTWVETTEYKNRVIVEERLYTLECSLGPSSPKELARVPGQYMTIKFGDDEVALIYGKCDTGSCKTQCLWSLAPGDLATGVELVCSWKSEEGGSDNPGMPMMLPNRHWPTFTIARVRGSNELLMWGSESLPSSNIDHRPFLRLLDVKRKGWREVWKCALGCTQWPFGPILNDRGSCTLDLDGFTIVMACEDPSTPQHLAAVHLSEGGHKVEITKLTTGQGRPAELAGMRCEVLSYARKDGVELYGKLYTPAGFKKGDGAARLPTLIWGYPTGELEACQTGDAVKIVPSQYDMVSATSPELWTAKGYAVLAYPTIPVTGKHDEAFDTYVPQVVDGVLAAVDAVVAAGVADPHRVCLGGHSFGANMTAVVLAHTCNTFACGIAQSGAYNRTLTPFGFQEVERSLWVAPDLYVAMSPFNYADRIKTPMLFIHGQVDENEATFPMQSERMFAALQFNGCPCRLVMLPYEGHNYTAKETLSCVLKQTEIWLDQHCLAGVTSAGGAHGSGQEDYMGTGTGSALSDWTKIDLAVYSVSV